MAETKVVRMVALRAANWASRSGNLMADWSASKWDSQLVAALVEKLAAPSVETWGARRAAE
jgi:hypothetical protein